MKCQVGILNYRRESIMKKEIIVANNIDNIYDEINALIREKKTDVKKVVNDAIISLNWGIGKRLSAEFTGDNKPEYGKKVVAEVSKRLEQEYGSGFDKTSISRMIKFYQEFPDFEKVATGSNAYMLSSEIATMISGRYIQIEMLPLSFKEYMERTGSMNDRGIKYAEYLQNSSFPFTLELKNQPDEIRDYLEGIYNTIVVKDIINRKKITDTMMLKSVLRFVFDNIGNPLSSKKIADTMTSEGRKIDTKTVEKYLEAFSESYIIYQAKRYNIKGKQYLKTLEKYYIVDIGMRYMLLGSRQADAGHVLENIVYLELLRRGYDVYVGKINSYEVDFVAQNKKGTVYFQVALTVRDENTLLRELRPLQAIRDHYPKIILTMDEEPEEQYEGIRRINARDWLLGIVD